MTDLERLVAYDRHGREIMTGDVLKVFHFVGRNRKRHYMYKQVLGVVTLNEDSDARFLKISHLDMSEDHRSHYHEFLDGCRRPDYEIVQSLGADFEDRPALAAKSREVG